MKTSDKPTQILNVQYPNYKDTNYADQYAKQKACTPKNTKHANQNTKYTKPKNKYAKQKTKYAKIHQVG